MCGEIEKKIKIKWELEKHEEHDEKFEQTFSTLMMEILLKQLIKCD